MQLPSESQYRLASTSHRQKTNPVLQTAYIYTRTDETRTESVPPQLHLTAENILSVKIYLAGHCSPPMKLVRS